MQIILYLLVLQGLMGAFDTITVEFRAKLHTNSVFSRPITFLMTKKTRKAG
ncbi:MAG: hypothetical protein NT086_17665 [Proteobacteria bacterium]|nr:hypothetical protein [Pseudomonadota bacterium]